MAKVFSIGYSNLSMEQFCKLLHLHGITAIADVRSSPYSKAFPNYNRESMPAWLNEAKVKYVYLGLELGPRSSDKSLYKNDQIQFSLLSQTDLFCKGIERLSNGSQNHNIAIMCAEKDPMTCHRSLLVAEYAKDHGLDFVHIHQNGDLETHDNMLKRAMAQYKIMPDMLTDEDTCKKMAHQKLCTQFAYKRTSPNNSMNGMTP